MVNEYKEIVFGSDTAERKRFFRAASFAHPAKMVLPLQIYLIENYTKPGETILDPMAGSGTILIACTLGRNVILVELENKFVDMQKANWQKIKGMGPMLGYKMGEATILQGDARNLEGLLADCAIFSPPYAEKLAGSGENSVKWWNDKAGGKNFLKKNYGENSNNIGNLKYGEMDSINSPQVDAVISSPPYANRLSDKAQKDNDPQRMSYRQALGKVDAVISSPPYEGSLARDRSQDESYREDREKTHAGGSIAIEKGYQLDPSIKRLRKHKRTDPGAGGPYGQSLAHPYSGADENIGNLTSENYLQAMLQVYRQCYGVLKDGGLMCIVTKNFIRNRKIIRLDLDTIKLCEQAGFTLIERLKRKLTQQSFWRTIYYQRFPSAPKIEHEDILIFKKYESR